MVSSTDRLAYIPRHAASPPVTAADPRRFALLAAAVALTGLSAYALTADWTEPRGPEGRIGGGAPVTPGALPGATGLSAAPSKSATTASRTADPDVADGGSAPTAPGATAPRTSTADAAGGRSAPAAPRATASRTANRGAATGGPGRDPVHSGVPRPTTTPGHTEPASSPTRSPVEPPPSLAPELCGAPENPYGYNYCGGVLVHEAAPDVCRWFDCVPGFWAGRGYLTVCSDGRIGMVGGPTGRCPERAGRKDPVYANQPATG